MCHRKHAHSSQMNHRLLLGHHLHHRRLHLFHSQRSSCIEEHTIHTYNNRRHRLLRIESRPFLLQNSPGSPEVGQRTPSEGRNQLDLDYAFAPGSYSSHTQFHGKNRRPCAHCADDDEYCISEHQKSLSCTFCFPPHL